LERELNPHFASAHLFDPFNEYNSFYNNLEEFVFVLRDYTYQRREEYEARPDRKREYVEVIEHIVELCRLFVDVGLVD
jgi:hypothetical protein